ncbi:DNA helicase SRS2 [Sugiyamaella lignohabitans]|uniref:DNA 3'-5' helicase n=1 Tax=Sugiyamaella lignohabitans TaxID=796027 RepID=A0A167BZ03_9ASCO|nr:DNA helicase SRS2 [Sugiyamaella lignohabitans]ANB11000.1 DNA helicase SRS2 [Sugiyamaella lignohabitans]
MSEQDPGDASLAGGAIGYDLISGQALESKAWGIEEDLNDQQLRAVQLPVDANIQVIAGPGTGKTKTLVNRLLYILTEYNVPPEKVLVLTFTNRAIHIFRESLFKLAPAIAPQVEIHTFHSYCQSLISDHWEEVGLRPGWTVADDMDQEYILTEVIKETVGSHTTAREFRVLSNKLHTYKRSLLNKSAKRDSKLDEILTKYETRLAGCNMLDYDGILKLGYRLAEKYSKAPESDKNKYFSALLIDEFQDANLFQWDLTCLIAKGSASITIVGDPDQSIFSFQGASSNLLDIMKKQLSDVRTVVLTQNYRSSQEIVDAASAMIREDSHFLGDEQMPVGLFTGPKPIFKKSLDSTSETVWVANTIHHLTHKENVEPSSIAVLVRTNGRKDSVAAGLRQRGIEVAIYGPLSLLKSPYIRPLYSFLKFIQNFEQDIQLLYMLRNPNKILSPKQISEAQSFSRSRGLPLWEALQQNQLWLRQPTTRVNKSKKPHGPPDLDQFISVINKSADIIHSNVHDSESLVEGLQLVSQYLSWPTRYGDKAHVKQQELFDLITSIAPLLKDESTSLSSSLLAHTRLQDIAAKPGEVVVSTIHNAKGRLQHCLRRLGLRPRPRGSCFAGECWERRRNDSSAARGAAGSGAEPQPPEAPYRM